MKSASALALSLTFAAAAASPALAARLPDCPGDYAVIRTSTVKPGKLDEFLKAVRDNQAWYASHGLPDRILFGHLADRDAQGVPTGAFSPNLVTTIHTSRPPTPPAVAADDAQWQAFVAEYEDSSDLASVAAVCLTAP
jgi:ABC-type nitrate/sulfonate/bicarbonate transport system substrate-binding protein